MLATLTSKGRITLPKEIRDRLGLDAGSILEFTLLPDDSIVARAVKPDARRVRGIGQMDEAVAAHLREKHAAKPKAGEHSRAGCE